MKAKRIGWVLGPAAALALALGPVGANVASADTGGTVIVLSPGANVIGGVEVAGVSTSGLALSCIYALADTAPQTCVMPTGQGAPDPLVAAPAANDGNVQVAGVAANTAGIAFASCFFDEAASGPQTCAINSL